MLDLSGSFNELLKKHESSTISRKGFSLDEIDEFLKEAYRINSHISALHTELKDVRQAYLSTAQPRKTHLRSDAPNQQRQYLTDRQREEIDANAKQMLRELNAKIRALDDAEELRQQTTEALIKKKFSRTLGAFGSWATGGAVLGSSKSPEHLTEEERSNQLAAHRESVVWYLRQRLQRCGQLQQTMMETRLTREMEKNRSVLSKASGGQAGMLSRPLSRDWATSPTGHLASSPTSRFPGGQLPAQEEKAAQQSMEDDLTAEQIQMFEKGNQDMLKHYENALDKVRTAEKSLMEISELQTLLVNNLTTQSAHIDQLVAESFQTAEEVGGGNKELKKASQRKSPARYTFFAASGLCLFLIAWDLII